MAEKSPSKVDEVARLRIARAERWEKQDARAVGKADRKDHKARNSDSERRDTGLLVQGYRSSKSFLQMGASADLPRGEGKVAIKPAGKVKRGRPRIDEPREKPPWEVAGMSERTWYRRRQKEAKK